MGVTSDHADLRFSILGPLQAEAGGQRLDLGGWKQQAVLAALLLRAGEIVPDERLVDAVWAERPPSSAVHSLEAYVSKLRGVLAPHGVVVERRGGGYRIDLAGGTLDAAGFARGVEDASQALTADDHRRAATSAREALGLWRGPVLSGVPLHLDARAEADRLEELRSRALEISVEAELALGRHAELVGELRPLVEASPYRERLVSQLMLALYRSGRQAEALELYERTRRALDEELGLRPSEELQRLAGQIVRQEPHLNHAPPPLAVVRAEPQQARRRRGAIAIAAAVAVVAAAALTIVAATAGRDALPGTHGPTRVALIRMWNPGAPGSRQDAGWAPFVDGLLAAGRSNGLETEIVDLFPRRPALGGYEQGSVADVERLSARMKAEGFDLVLWPLGLTGPNFYSVIPENPATWFVFLDFCCARDWPLNGRPNVTAITLRADRAAHLAGYLSALMESRRPLAKGRRHVVSSITGDPDYPQEVTWARGFAEGARRAVPGIIVRESYSGDYDHPAVCERIANEQIDAGSGVVFAAAGECGRGAYAAAAVRGVWTVPAAEDLSYLGTHILASATKRFDHLVEESVRLFLEGRLPAGGDVELGLTDDAVALVGISPKVPPGIRSRVAREAERLKADELRAAAH